MSCCGRITWNVCIALSRARSLTIPQMPSKWRKTNDMPRDEHQLTKPGVAGGEEAEMLGEGRRVQVEAEVID